MLHVSTPDQGKVGSNGCNARPKTDALRDGGIHRRRFENGKQAGAYGEVLRGEVGAAFREKVSERMPQRKVGRASAKTAKAHATLLSRY